MAFCISPVFYVVYWTQSDKETTTWSRKISTPVRTFLLDMFIPSAHFVVDIQALSMVDAAYQDRTEWIKKSIRTTAKVRLS